MKPLQTRPSAFNASGAGASMAAGWARGIVANMKQTKLRRTVADEDRLTA
jgi:hypothetical protein